MDTERETKGRQETRRRENRGSGETSRKEKGEIKGGNGIGWILSKCMISLKNYTSMKPISMSNEYKIKRKNVVRVLNYCYVHLSINHCVC